jgi:hypothetical protein
VIDLVILVVVIGVVLSGGGARPGGCGWYRDEWGRWWR